MMAASSSTRKESQSSRSLPRDGVAVGSRPVGAGIGVFGLVTDHSCRWRARAGPNAEPRGCWRFWTKTTGTQGVPAARRLFVMVAKSAKFSVTMTYSCSTAVS